MRRWLAMFIAILLVGCSGKSLPLPTVAPMATAVSTSTAEPLPTDTPASIATATARPTPTPLPTGTPAQTALPTPVPTSTAAPTPVAPSNPLARLHVGDNGDGYGFNVWGLTDSAAARNAMYANIQGAGFGWMRQQVQWAAMEPQRGTFRSPTATQLDQFVNGASAKGLKVMLSVVKSPDWVGAKGGLPTSTGDFTDFMTFLAQRYTGKVQAYEIWNEENYAVETGGKVNVAAYLPVLKAGYQAVKVVDPTAVVVFGGLTPTGITDPAIALNDIAYLRQLYALNGGEVKQYYDVLGAHPGSNCNPPDTSWPDNPATTPCGTDPDGGRSYTKDDSFYFKRILEVRQVLEDAGEGSKKIWLTEFGWTTANQAAGYGYGKYVSEQQQAQYLVRAFELGKSYPWMGVMFVWNLNFSLITPPSDEKYPWAVLNGDGSPRPAYTALKEMPK